LGGRQPGLDFAVVEMGGGFDMVAAADRPIRPPRPHAATPEELAAHRGLLATIANAMWNLAG
jgi:DNA polymerase-3 subunit epsilon